MVAIFSNLGWGAAFGGGRYWSWAIMLSLLFHVWAPRLGYLRGLFTWVRLMSAQAVRSRAHRIVRPRLRAA